MNEAQQKAELEYPSVDPENYPGYLGFGVNKERGDLRKAYIKGYQAGQQSLWIPVGERLPEEGTVVLIHCAKFGYRGTGSFEGDRWLLHGVGENNDVTHWQSTPLAPEKP